jgi:4-carboxymuconolactone decarboxylase
MSVDDARYERGLSIRREVLGADHVERSLRRATDFTSSLQELITEYCWGEVWARPGLDRRTRSMINIAILTSLNRQRELALHVRGALRNGCTEDEIKEVLLQTAIYSGVPAALDASRTAEAVFQNREHPQDSAHEPA